LKLFFSGRASPVEEDLDTSDEVPPEILNDVDDEDDDDEVAFREAIRLSQIDQMSDLRKREEEEFQKVKYFLWRPKEKCLWSPAIFAAISAQNFAQQKSIFPV